MKLLKFGMKGEPVAELQRELIAQGYQLAETADFDEPTEAALMQFQRDKNLLVDGIFGKDSYAVLFGSKPDDSVPVSKFLKESDIVKAAEMLEVEPAVIKAIVRVESRGRGYLNDGRVLILFERHKFYDFLGKKNATLARETYEKYPRICNPDKGGYIGFEGEYPRFSLAYGIDAELAMQSASWGLFQIMGFNYRLAGCETIHEFVDAMKESEGKQLELFCNFIKNHRDKNGKPALWQAVKKKDWGSVALYYNGAGYKKHSYDSKLANAYARYKTDVKTA